MSYVGFNTISTYKQQSSSEGGKFILESQELYGSERLGENKETRLLATVKFTFNGYLNNKFKNIIYRTPIVNTLNDSTYKSFGYTNYELTNHLGNVMATVSDKITPNQVDVVNNNIINFSAMVTSANTYYPYGMLKPNTSSLSGYRFGYQGQEKDSEIKGEGNSYNFSFRIYDSRIAKFLSPDPLRFRFPFYSPYHFSSNSPIAAVDLEGLQPWVRSYNVDIDNKSYVVKINPLRPQRFKIRYHNTNFLQKSAAKYAFKGKRKFFEDGRRYSPFFRQIGGKPSSMNLFYPNNSQKFNANEYDDDGKITRHGSEDYNDLAVNSLIDGKTPKEFVDALLEQNPNVILNIIPNHAASQHNMRNGDTTRYVGSPNEASDKFTDDRGINTKILLGNYKNINVIPRYNISPIEKYTFHHSILIPPYKHDGMGIILYFEIKNTPPVSRVYCPTYM